MAVCGRAHGYKHKRVKIKHACSQTSFSIVSPKPKSHKEKAKRKRSIGRESKGKRPTCKWAVIELKSEKALQRLMQVRKRMFWPLKLKKTVLDAPLPIDEVPSGYLIPKPATELLSTPRRSKLVEHIWQRTSLSRAQFDTFYLDPIKRYAALVQELPASENHHHAHAGGMLDHGLEIIAFALKIRQSYLLPVGATPEC